MASETIDTQKMIYLPMENMASETIETQKNDLGIILLNQRFRINDFILWL